MLCFMGFYVFAAADLTARFGMGAQAASIAMFLLGAGLALASGFLVGPINDRLPARPILVVVTLLLCAVISLFVLMPTVALALALLLPAGVLHGVGYPTLLSAFSRAAGKDEQGWVMGFSTALFTLAAAIVSFAGGALTAAGPAGTVRVRHSVRACRDPCGARPVAQAASSARPGGDRCHLSGAGPRGSSSVRTASRCLGQSRLFGRPKVAAAARRHLDKPRACRH